MISLHINVDGLSPAVLDRALLYLVRTHQRSVQIAAGAEIQKGMDYVDRVRAALPHIIIYWRNLDPEDTGIHAKYSPQWVFDHKVLHYLAWFKRNNVVFVPDNESSGNDDQIKAYALWMVSFLILMHAVNLATAVCRFATGNIQDGTDPRYPTNQYNLLKPIFSAMLPMDWISPNEYSNAPGKSSGGHLARYENMWVAAGKRLPTSIGEAGICPDYDPGKGYRSINMSAKAVVEQLTGEEIWYEGGAIDRFVFSVAINWGGFNLIKEIGDGKVEADVLDELEKHYAKQPAPVPIPPTPTPPPVPIPAPGPVEPPKPAPIPQPPPPGVYETDLRRLAIIRHQIADLNAEIEAILSRYAPAAQNAA